MFAVFPHNLFLFSPAASIISAPYRKFHHPKSTRFQQRFYNYNIYLSRRKIHLRSFRWSIEAILIRWIMLYATDRAKKSGGFPSISTPLFIPWYDLVDMVFSQNTAHFPSRNPFPLCHRVTIPLISFMPSAASVLFWMPHSHHFVQYHCPILLPYHACFQLTALWKSEIAFRFILRIIRISANEKTASRCLTALLSNFLPDSFYTSL